MVMNSTQFIGSGFYIDPSLELIWIPLAIQLIATLIGAFVGFSFVMLSDRKKKREETQQTKIRMLDAIIEELEDFQKMVDPQKTNPAKLDWNNSTRDFVGTYITISTPAFQSAINSGNFSLLIPSLQTELGNIYLTLDQCKLFNDQAISFYSTSIFASNNGTVVDREANRICNNFNIRISDLRSQLQTILPKLKSAKIKKKLLQM
jgi:hypothetical protein